jgi:lipopolysaccharide transport system ATP-binding protein
MSDIAVRIRNLSKRYRIGQRERHNTLRDSFMDAIYSPLRRLSALAHQVSDVSAPQTASDEWIWALKDISFDVKPGEVVGIIGRNGAGKSTLLKILSRITEPTEGYAEIHGSVGTLLEVGTGFHGELTGRENIYLSGVILGMKKAEIERRFDEIVSFAEVEEFIDTPVKHYSTGMYLRLAFSVAAHLEPEILIVDEVLAVGDARFQEKCFDKIQNMGNEGRTVLFVSHNMPAITRICPRTILLDAGTILGDGPSQQITSQYLSSSFGVSAEREWRDLSQAPGNDIVRLCAVRARTEDGRIMDAMDIRKPIGIEMEYEVLKPGNIFMPNFHFYNEQGLHLFFAGDSDPAWHRKPRPAGRYVSTAWIPGNLLSEGTLFVAATIVSLDPVTIHFFERDAIAFQVMDSLDGDSARGDYAGAMPGVIRPLLHWDTVYCPNRIERNPPLKPESNPSRGN